MKRLDGNAVDNQRGNYDIKKRLTKLNSNVFPESQSPSSSVLLLFDLLEFANNITKIATKKDELKHI